MNRTNPLQLPHIWLASASPRRKALISILTTSVSILPSHADETIEPHLSPEEMVKRLAERKANSVLENYPAQSEIWQVTEGWLLAADTIVVVDGLVLNKPKDKAEAIAMLSLLSGRWHEVYTGFHLRALRFDSGAAHSISRLTLSEVTKVRFIPLSIDEIERYIEHAKPYDKAGSYGIQDDLAACFIDRIEGCYYNVVGLPLPSLYKAMKRLMIEDGD